MESFCELSDHEKERLGLDGVDRGGVGRKVRFEGLVRRPAMGKETGRGWENNGFFLKCYTMLGVKKVSAGSVTTIVRLWVVELWNWRGAAERRCEVHESSPLFCFPFSHLMSLSPAEVHTKHLVIAS